MVNLTCWVKPAGLFLYTIAGKRKKGALQNSCVIIYGAALHFYVIEQKTDSEESAIHGIISYDE